MVESQVIASRFKIHNLESDLLGKGGMGKVFRATDLSTGDTVAIKSLYSDTLARSPELLVRFQREDEALRQLNHPTIVKFIAAVEENGCHYLVMDYVSGGSLKDCLLREGKLPAGRVVEIALDLADALTRAHRLNILHRDLKPANVLLAEDGTPRLADFGIAHLSSGPQVTQTGMLVGTVDYASPEMIQGEPPDERVDIWGLGVMLFELLTGKLPFSGSNLTARLNAILTQPTPDIDQSVSGVPESLADLVYRMLEKDPQHRIPSMRLVGVELAAILKGGAAASPGRTSQGESRSPGDTPAVKSPKHNLPVQLTPFIGREKELQALSGLLDDPDVRLVTITGLGGMGKTRLGLETAAAKVDQFHDGVFFVPLAPIQSPSLIVPTIAGVVGLSLRMGVEPIHQLASFLCFQQTLLVLDNFEHMLNDDDSDARQIVDDILQAARNVKVLITSRSSLKLVSEHIFPLEGMDVDIQEHGEQTRRPSSVRLFLQHLYRVQPGFSPGSQELADIEQICRFVGGMPLGIELAASWGRILTPAEIVVEIRKNLDVLETVHRDLPARQRSLRVVFDYSWSLLSEREQVILEGLSVFRGGFTREAAQYLSGASLRDLMAVVESSLLQRKPSGRYEMHESIRQYAAEKLAQGVQADAFYQSHLEYFLRLAEETEPQLRGDGDIAGIKRLDLENDNLRTAFDRALQSDNARYVLRLCGALNYFWQRSGRIHEGMLRLKQSLQMPKGKEYPLEFAKAAHCQGMMFWLHGDYRDALEMLEQSLDLVRAYETPVTHLLASALCWRGLTRMRLLDFSQAARDVAESLDLYRSIQDAYGLAFCYYALGRISIEQGNHSDALPVMETALKWGREAGEKWIVALILNSLVLLALNNSDYAAARELNQEMLKTARLADEIWMIANGLREGGNLAQVMGDYPAAYQHFQESGEISRQQGLQNDYARSRLSLGYIALLQGDYGCARTLIRESTDLFKQLNHWRGQVDALDGFANLVGCTGKPELAACLLGASDVEFQSLGLKRWPADQHEYQKLRSRLEASLGNEKFTLSYQKGQMMGVKQALEAVAML